ncbi:hypothetical protein [Micrococcus terreus]|uniref:hypothetical protein n=1 Tax=Micrococcus terreus TaxID=574650 RepID=UPI003018B5B5
MDIVVALLIGALVGWLIGRRRAAATGSQQADLARAWQEGYDAGSLVSQRDVTLAQEQQGRSGGTPERSPEQLHAPGSWPTPPKRSPSAGVWSPSPPADQLSPAGQLPTASPGTSQPAPPAWRPATDEELAQERRRRDHRNVNITLYAACLILVAAASLFIGTALPASARMIGLAAVTGLFYVGGLIVHTTSRRVRPAAAAFTGTGLALVPISGLALDLLVLHRPVLSWLITSAVGTVLMVVAAARLRSRVVAYLAVPFLLSTVIASGAAAQQGMVWGLTASIAVATVMAWLTADEARVRWLPEEFRRALGDLHHWVTPGVVLLAMVVGSWLEPLHFVVLLLAAGGYYVTVAVLGRSARRLYAAYGARLCITAAVVAFVWMLDASVQVMAGALAVALGVQVLVTTLALWRDRGSPGRLMHAGFLPAHTGVRADQLAGLGLLWILALVAQVTLQNGVAVPVSLAWALLVLLTALAAVLGLLRPTTIGESVGWQAASAVSLVPGVLFPVAQGPWRLITVVAVAASLQLLWAVLLRRSGPRTRIDVKLAPDLTAVLVLILVGLLVDRWDGTGPQTWPTVVVAVLSVAWATVRAFRPGEPEDALEAGVWSAFILVGLGATVFAVAETRDSSVVQTLVLVLMLVAGAGALWWLRGREPEAVDGTAHRSEPRLSAPLGLVLGTTCSVMLTGWAIFAVKGFAGLEVTSLVVLCCWLTLVGLMSTGRLGEPTRMTTMIAGQAVLAVAVAALVDLLGADAAASRGAAAVTLAGGLMLRHLLRHRGAVLGGGAWSAVVVTGALAALWAIEAVDTHDRAALTVIALSLGMAGGVLGRARGGHWALLTAVVVGVAGLSDLMLLRQGGWLPEPLFSAGAAAAVFLLLVLKLTVDEARQDSRTSRLFRPVASAVLWSVALLCALVPETQWAILVVGAAVAALVCYVLARSRSVALLVLGTVLAVPSAVALVLAWGRAEAIGSLEDRWWAAAVGVITLGVLCGGAMLDRRRTESTVLWDRAAVLEYGGLAVLLAGGLVSAASPDVAVMMTGCALTALGLWIPVLWWTRDADPFPTSWRRHALDGAVLATVMLGLYAWWQAAEVERVLQASWWSMQLVALTLASLAGGHLRDRVTAAVRRRRATLWGGAAATVMTAASALVLVDGSTLMQLVSLLLFAALMVVGLTTRTSLFTWWGAAGVTLAVLWFLRGYTVLWLTLLGAVLIGLAVRQLMRGAREDRKEPSPTDQVDPLEHR